MAQADCLLFSLRALVASKIRLDLVFMIVVVRKSRVNLRKRQRARRVVFEHSLWRKASLQKDDDVHNPDTRAGNAGFASTDARRLGDMRVGGDGRC